ncbi:MAG: NAD(P)(+) transhydrogenase (Re/Si-specific) subunit alpha [Candidatus Eisenbacteria bacterium]|nr:NAD(P)(+) transhydrogenase (Re/Si-specific) subunit alpha [Candidatus Latescibacterota bacterium]MBD3301974.1 NAD(P)(+) transhydrogenase (Re/Si-specific) subunit alpha [Candidatus Eisenbacteria bacterium]
MVVGIPKEANPEETRVAVTPAVAATLKRRQDSLAVLVEAGAGEAAGFSDDAYREAGAEIARDRAELFSRADVILQIDGYGAEPDAGEADLDHLREGQVLVGFHDVLIRPRAVRELAERGVTVFSLELLPRITRAQSMDPITSMASVSGYKAVLLAAGRLPRMFPLQMTPAGTIPPARVFVLGAGIAGLQAIATAKRLGATVRAYDLRPAAREQVESLGAKFIDFDLPAEDVEDKSGYAKEMGEEFYRRQREFLSRVLADSDVVITTAAVPGKRAPVLITEAMISGMAPGSVIVDLAADHGGNCEKTERGKTVVVAGVWIIGASHLTRTVPSDASQMFARNVEAFLLHHLEEGKLRLEPEDEITRETLILREGRIVNERVADLLEKAEGGD